MYDVRCLMAYVDGERRVLRTSAQLGRAAMRKQIKRAMLVAGILMVAVPGAVLAQDKYTLNIQAYKGITFSELFGNVPDLDVRFPFAVDPEWNSMLAGLQSAISLEVFVERVSLNLQQYEGPTAEDTALVTEVSEKIALLAAYLNQLDGDSVWIKAWPVRWFFDDDLKAAVFSDQSLQNAVKGLFVECFEPLDKAGLTLPWLLVANKGTYGELFDLLYASRFLQRFSRMTYEDLFTITVDNPLVDDEIMELAQEAIEIGLLGALQVYKADPQATITAVELAVGGITPLGSYQCCHRLQRVCKVASMYSSYCNMCGTYCCIGSTWCP